MDGDRALVGTMNIGLDGYAVVNKIAEKYTGTMLPVFGNINEALSEVYDKCEEHEVIILLVLINDKSTFNKRDIPLFDKALAEWPVENDNPKKYLVFIRDLLHKHETIITEYAGVSTAAFRITS